ncbi:hypothetical protein FACS189447_03460 [Spirochaetia bacterium]|nr:hypothetical protein FACS189447_03460 [Spirochaetia bacterium]
MAEISTSIAHENEIVKSADFEHGFGSLIKNIALLDKMLVSSSVDYLIGGTVKADHANSMNVYVEPLFSNGKTVQLFGYLDHNSPLIALNPSGGEDRIDLLQIKGELEDYDEQQRAFYDSESESEIYLDVKTKSRLIVSFEIKQGAGSVAPQTDPGWIKVAEIFVPANSLIVTQANIRNVTAQFQGDETAAWTNEKARTFNLGSWNELKTIYGMQHNIDGSHKANVIKAGNIFFGTGADQVHGKVIPLGEGIELGNAPTEEEEEEGNLEIFTPGMSIFAAIKQEAETRKAQIEGIYLNYEVFTEALDRLIRNMERTYPITISASGVKEIPFTELGLQNGDTGSFKAQLIGDNPFVRNIGVTTDAEKTKVLIYVYFDKHPYDLPVLGAPVVKLGQKKLGTFLLGESDPIYINLFVRKEVL